MTEIEKMNDRFKFRFWNKSRKIMETFNGFSDAIGDILTNEIKAEPYIIMQSTGLKDKNGKLIYEGDIVKNFHVSSTMQGRVFTGFVTYDDERCRYCILETKNCGYATFSDTDDVFEVIGNIYENKDLLNENS